MRRTGFWPALLLASSSAFSAPVNTDREATEIATRGIHRFHLTALRAECRSIDTAERNSYFELTVRERHTRRCGGDPETAPRLFDVRVRKRDGRLTSDVYDGVYYVPVDHRPDRNK